MGKIDIMERSVEAYKKLPEEKKMFVLGIMQGIILEHEEKKVLGRKEYSVYAKRERVPKSGTEK